MTQKVKKIKQMQPNSQWSVDIPIGVTLDNGLDLEERFDKTEYVFDNVAEMVTADYLKAGDCVKTLGYYETNDLGSSFYKIREIANNDIVNNMNIISLNNVNLIAEFIPINEKLNIKQFGAYTDDSHDDSEVIQYAIDYISTNYTPYIQAGSQLELIGNYKNTKITKTIEMPHTLRARGLYLNIYTGTYTDNYAIKINIKDSDVTTWQISYPRENIGYIKESRFYNKTINAYNCILNGSCNLFEDISIDGFDISFKSINEYLDSFILRRCHITSVIDSTNYPIIMGMLGDKVAIEDCSIDGYGEDGQNNLAVDSGQGHNCFIMTNNIIHGKINIQAGTTIIKGLHMERGKINFNGSNATLENAFLWKDGSNINIESKSNIKISNTRIIYRYIHYSYENITDDDITIDNSSNLVIEESYKYIVGSSITGNNNAFLKVSTLNYPVNNIRSVLQGIRTKVNDYYPFPGSFTEGVIDTNKNYVLWNEASGTYYYKVIKMIDFERKLCFATYSNEFNLTFTNGQGGMRSTGAYKNSKWTIYRGSTSDSYNKVANISYATGEIYDNGFMINGNKWIPRTTAGDIDTFNTCRNNLPTKYDENDNIICHMADIPTVGTWKVDDIVITASATYICTESNNSGGIWREI